MKKVALSLAGVLAAAAFAPEASAIPAFARQTGMACSSCHAQHFPVLNGFGRAFKAAGFTMMGAQEKVEGEHLSLPSSLNAAVLLKARYQKTSAADDTLANTNAGVKAGDPLFTVVSTTNGGQWQIPDELSLFFGGRVADSEMIKVGMMMENNMVGGPAGGIIAGLRVPVVVDFGVATVSVIPYVTDALGAFYGYTESSTGVTRGIRWAEHRKDISAHQFTGIGDGTASGIAFVAHHEMGYINVSRFSNAFGYVPDATGTAMSSTAVHVAVTPTIADFATVIGFESLSGKNRATPFSAEVETKGVGFDAQAHGEVAGMEAGLYATYAKNDTAKKTATTVGVDVTVVPHTLSLGTAVRLGKTGANNTTDNAVVLTAVYDLFQNVALHANYSMYSGDANKNADAVGGSGKSLFTGLFEAAW